MSVDALLSRLEQARQTGPGRWTARCPAHEDRRASLSIRELDDGRVLLHDFAGCAVEDVLKAAGLDFEALFPARAIGHNPRRERKPFRVGELVRALDFELRVALIVLGDVAAARPIADGDRERANIARMRVIKFLGELAHAA